MCRINEFVNNGYLKSKFKMYSRFVPNTCSSCLNTLPFLWETPQCIFTAFFNTIFKIGKCKSNWELDVFKFVKQYRIIKILLV